ncbi:MAG: class I SAM-dependent methyltransferase [Chloroflexota bacterium]
MIDLIKRYLQRISGGTSRMNRESLADLIEPCEKARVLDIGCAEGKLIRKLASKIRVGEIYGIEISPKYAEEAHKNSVNIIIGDVDIGLPFKDASFDIVISNQVIEHVNSTDNFIKECYRVLKNRGTCIASTPNLATPHNIFSLILGYQPPATAVSDEIICGNPLDPCNGQQIASYRRHRRIFTTLSLQRLFQFHGFKVEVEKGVGLQPLPLFLSKHFTWARYSQFLTIKVRKPES